MQFCQELEHSHLFVEILIFRRTNRQSAHTPTILHVFAALCGLVNVKWRTANSRIAFFVGKLLKQKNRANSCHCAPSLLLHCVIVLPEMSLKLIFVAWPIVCSFVKRVKPSLRCNFVQFGNCFSCIVCIVHASVRVVLIAFVSVSSSLSGVWIQYGQTFEHRIL